MMPKPTKLLLFLNPISYKKPQRAESIRVLCASLWLSSRGTKLVIACEEHNALGDQPNARNTYVAGTRRRSRSHEDRQQSCLDIVGRLSRHVYAGWICFLRDRLHSRKERCAHDGHEHHGLRNRLARLLGLRIRVADGRRRGTCVARWLGFAGCRVHHHNRRPLAWSSWHEGFFSKWRCLRRRRVCSVPLLDGVHGHGCDDTDRRNG